MAHKRLSRAKIAIVGGCIAVLVFIGGLIFIENPQPCATGPVPTEGTSINCDSGPLVGDALSLTLFLTFAVIGITAVIAAIHGKK
jgi:hypothetical protein